MIPYFVIPPLKLGPLSFHAFGALVALGFILGSHLAAKRASRVGLNPQVIYDVSLLCIIFGFLGAHVFDSLTARPEEVLKNPLELLKVWSGLSSYGGFLGAGIALWVYFKRKGIPFLPYADALMFGLFPGWILGRLGCFTAHDHPGELSDFVLAVQFPGGARHDLGLYEAFLTMVLTAILFFIGRKGDVNHPKSGAIYAWMLVLYGVPRFFLDFLRKPGTNPEYFGIKPAQYSSIAIVLLGLYMFFHVYKKRKA